jgi:hypothetical protein
MSEVNIDEEWSTVITRTIVVACFIHMGDVDTITIALRVIFDFSIL